jgi:hypothetical protein
MNLSKLAGAHSFANLLGLSAKKADDDQDEERKQKDGESDDDYAARMKKLDDEEAAAEKDDPEDKSKGKKSRKKGKNAAEDDETCDDDEDDEEDEPDERVKKAEARGRRLERERGAAIFASEQATANIALTAHLAFNTGLSAKSAIEALKHGGAAPGGRLAAHMAERPQPRIGSGDGAPPSSQDAVARSWEHAAKPFMPKTK